MGIHVATNGALLPHRPKRHLLNLETADYGRGIVAYTPNATMIARLVEEAAPTMGIISSMDSIMRVFRHNPETITVYARGAWREEVGNAMMGFLCLLPLTKDGYEALFDGRLDTKNPDTVFIARQNEKPAAIYLWGIYLSPKVGGGLALSMERLTSDKYRSLPIYCRAANATAHALFMSLGFKQGAVHEGLVKPELLSLVRPDPMIDRPKYDNFDPNVERSSARLGITVAHSLSDVMKVFAIRAATYIEDQAIPYDEDIDGNDFCASHLLGYVGLEPAGCLRIRYFADFVKFERLAVLPRYRGRLALQIVRAGIAFAQMKGYRRFYGHAAEDVAPIWKHFGFKQRDTEGTQFLTDQTYYEFDMELPGPEQRLTPESGPVMLVRPEGKWDIPCSFERTD
jgi:predicted GNAT family N-acyltransferase